MDLLDFLTPKDKEFLTAKYYKKNFNNVKGLGVDDGGIAFQYEIIDEPRKAYATIFGSVETNRAYQTIRTNDFCGFTIGGTVLTQEGRAWQIEEIITGIQDEGSKEALRLLKTTNATTYTLRMLEVNNRWGIK